MQSELYITGSHRIQTTKEQFGPSDHQTMISMSSFTCIVVLSFLLGMIVTKEHKMFQFGHCELSGISFRELRDNFGEIKETIQTQDNRTDVILLKESVLLETPVSESCCLLRHLLRFYIESVFRHYETTNNLLRRKISTLANTFLRIKATLRQCHDQNKCSCGAESHQRYRTVLEEYEKLDRNTAAVKAMGEMDILFAWMRDINN